MMNSISNIKGKKCVKDLQIALKDIEPHVRRVEPLWNGPPFENFSLRAREIWSLWLLCAVMGRVNGKRVTFCEDDERDGILVDLDADNWIKVENVAVMKFGDREPLQGEQGIIEAIQKKIDKGEQYAKGLILTVFYDGIGEMYVNRVAKHFAGKHHFEKIYLIGLITDNGGAQYSYVVNDLYEHDASIYRIDISPDFLSWEVTQIQRSVMDK